MNSGLCRSIQFCVSIIQAQAAGQTESDGQPTLVVATTTLLELRALLMHQQRGSSFNETTSMQARGGTIEDAPSPVSEGSVLMRQIAFLTSNLETEPISADGHDLVPPKVAVSSFGSTVDDMFARWSKASFVEVCKEAILSGHTPLAQVFFKHLSRSLTSQEEGVTDRPSTPEDTQAELMRVEPDDTWFAPDSPRSVGDGELMTKEEKHRVEPESASTHVNVRGFGCTLRDIQRVGYVLFLADWYPSVHFLAMLSTSNTIVHVVAGCAWLLLRFANTIWKSLLRF